MPSLDPGYTLEAIHRNAIQELRARKEGGSLSTSDFELIAQNSSFEDVVSQFNAAVGKCRDSEKKRRIPNIGHSVVHRLEKFGMAIDMLAQSMPEVVGINPVGIIWGSIRFILIIAQDVSNTLQAILDVFDDLAAALPRVEIYVRLFSSSDIQLLKGPLMQLYSEIVRFGLLATNVFNRSMVRNIWNSIWTSLHVELQVCIKRIEKTSDEVNIVAQAEHMHQSNNEAKNQRREIEKSERFRQDARMFFAHVRSSSKRSTGSASPEVTDIPQYLLSHSFTGRSQELSTIDRTFKSSMISPIIFAVYGMSGLGKTQIALKYSTTSLSSRQYACVFWLQASSIQILHQGFTNILNLVDHQDRYHPDEEARLTMARLWLERYEVPTKDGCGWLLVIDDASPPVLPFLRRHLPRANSTGKILLTTQSEVVAKAIATSPSHILELGVPSPEDAEKLFINVVKRESSWPMDVSKDDLGELVKSIGYLPLAVAHAADFIVMSRMDIQEFIKTYRSDQKMELLGWENKLSTYEERSVLATFKRKFDYFDRNNHAASHLFRFLSFFNSERIQVEILREGVMLWAEQAPSSIVKPVLIEGRWKPRCSTQSDIPSTETEAPAPSRHVSNHGIRFQMKKLLRSSRTTSRPPPTPPALTPSNAQNHHALSELCCSMLNRDTLHNALGFLEDHSLVTRIHNSTSTTLELRMHDLVKFMIQKTAMTRDDRVGFLNFASEIACNALRGTPDHQDPLTWKKSEAVIPHLVSLKTIAIDLGLYEANENMIWANGEMAEFYKSRGLYSEAEACYMEELTRHAKQDPKALPVAKHLRGLADVLVKQGRYGEAEDICLRGLPRMLELEKLMEDSLGIAVVLVNVYDKQARYAEAIELGTKILDPLGRTAGKSHSDYLETMHNLGLAYGHSAHYENAQKMLEGALDIYRAKYGPEHPETLRSINALANLYDRKQHHEKASELYIKALEGRERLFGPDHSQTLKSVCGLANLWMRIGLLNEAKDLYLRALEANEKHNASPTPDLLRAVHGLAAVLSSQERFEQAMKQYQRAAEGRCRILGKDHADTLRSYEGLGIANICAGNPDEAKVLFERVLEGRKVCLGEAHPETVKVRQYLSHLGKAT